ncbi:hypothetical protein BDV95DRAFT_592216 [Massariosphaeria phaeospora]|uniref:Uncharacterized protein n=1 Tax=Massariosphaeria phaeospora TaxID=100035 RepID=A0A7C8MSV0_9PLEO|nr:hypothetical protein BDV95DRAFT_592216 [Massariosphaeria phaeospora]
MEERGDEHAGLHAVNLSAGGGRAAAVVVAVPRLGVCANDRGHLEAMAQELKQCPARQDTPRRDKRRRQTSFPFIWRPTSTATPAGTRTGAAAAGRRQVRQLAVDGHWSNNPNALQVRDGDSNCPPGVAEIWARTRGRYGFVASARWSVSPIRAALPRFSLRASLRRTRVVGCALSVPSRFPAAVAQLAAAVSADAATAHGFAAWWTSTDRPRYQTTRRRRVPPRAARPRGTRLSLEATELEEGTPHRSCSTYNSPATPSATKHAVCVPTLSCNTMPEEPFATE